MPQGQLAEIPQPSMASVLETLVGEWGSVYIRIGVILSVLGAYLAWTLMVAEVLFVPARSADDPTNRASCTKRVPDMAIAVVAVIYTVFLVWAAGLDKLLLSCILCALGTILYVKARREQDLPIFRRAEAVLLFGVFVIGAVSGIVYLATGSEDTFEHPEQERHSYYVDDPSATHPD